jgi:spore germination protein
MIRYMHMKLSIFVVALVIVLFGSPIGVRAESDDLQVAGWIPYWRDSEGIKDAKKHIRAIDIVHPFAFTVTTKGELRDQAGLDEKEWKNFVAFAHKNNTLVVPTVMWAEGQHIHEVLSTPSLRKAHIEGIVEMVNDGKYDGVDIDYESKKSETIDYFSRFLEELKEALGEKLLTCTIEARTPPESLYKEVPATINYANDYTEIAKHCDRVEIMAYDQQRADIKLNAEKAGEPYMPVSDVDWVEKVVKLALKDIPNEKIVLGISSYGHHYAVTVAPNWYRDYRKIGALNVPDILDIAKEYKVKPSRNKSGEMSFTYLPKSSKVKLTNSLKIPKNTPKGNLISARALLHADKTGEEVTFNMAWYGDAESMKQKIDLAKKYDLLGVAFFKIDGEEDQKVWKYLK